MGMGLWDVYVVCVLYGRLIFLRLFVVCVYDVYLVHASNFCVLHMLLCRHTWYDSFKMSVCPIKTRLMCVHTNVFMLETISRIALCLVVNMLAINAHFFMSSS